MAYRDDRDAHVALRALEEEQAALGAAFQRAQRRRGVRAIAIGSITIALGALAVCALPRLESPPRPKQPASLIVPRLEDPAARARRKCVAQALRHNRRAMNVQLGNDIFGFGPRTFSAEDINKACSLP